jgi:hypothetical protein
MHTLKAAYGISELADMSAMSRYAIYKLAKKHGLTECGGRQRHEKIHIPLSTFREAFPELWESILIRLQYVQED